MHVSACGCEKTKVFHILGNGEGSIEWTMEMMCDVSFGINSIPFHHNFRLLGSHVFRSLSEL